MADKPSRKIYEDKIDKSNVFEPESSKTVQEKPKVIEQKYNKHYVNGSLKTNVDFDPVNIKLIPLLVGSASTKRRKDS